MKIRVATGLMTAIAFVIYTGTFVALNVSAAQIDDQESIQQSQNKM